MTSTPPPPSPSDLPVAYLTDVEGRWEKLDGFCQDNAHVALEPGDRLVVRPGATFVFGGDAVDRGPAGRRVLRTLLGAWRRQPTQVVLLAGNRDINKLRLGRELTGHPLARTPQEVRQGPRPALLRWIFEHTMGARGAFEFRQEELAHTGAPAGDEDVVDSFVEDVAPGGLMRDYLAACQLAYRTGVTLFVHGGLHADSLGTVPGHPGRLDDVDAWSAALNDWYHAQIEAFVAGRRDDAGSPSWEPLIAYQAPVPGTRVNTASVVYGRMATALNHPSLPAPELIATLSRSGVHRVAVGHTPSGDCPSVLREGDFELVLADNSYGRVEGASRVFLGDARLHVEGDVVLDDGRLERLCCQLTRGEDSALGRQVRDTGQLVKGPLVGGDWLLFRALPGFQVEQCAVAPEALAHLPLGPARTG